MSRKDNEGSNFANAAEAYGALRTRAHHAIEWGDQQGVNVRNSRVRLCDEAGNVLFEGTVAEAAQLQFGSDAPVASTVEVAPSAKRFSIATTATRARRRRVASHALTRYLTEVDAETYQINKSQINAVLRATSDAAYRMSADWSEMRTLTSNGFIADTKRSRRSWLGLYIPAEDQTHVRAAIENAIRTKTVFNLTHRVLRVDGSIGWTWSYAVPIVTPGGDMREWIGLANDVTAEIDKQTAVDAWLSGSTADTAGPPKPGALADEASSSKGVIQKAIDDWSRRLEDPLVLAADERGCDSMATLIHRRLVEARLIDAP